MRKTALALVLAAVAAPAGADGWHPVEPAEAKIYRDCVADEAFKLEPSGEPAESVAKAAVTLCESKLEAAAAAIAAASNARQRELGWPGTSTYMEIEPQLRQGVADAAAAIIIAKRSRK